MKLILLILLSFFCCLGFKSQMLFTEGMTLEVDSNKRLQGIISPSLDFKTEQKNVLTAKLSTNMNLLTSRRRVINLINKFELSMYGKQIILSGGYIHAEYRYLFARKLEFYPYVESQWAASRGMIKKFSTGVQARYHLINKPKSLLTANSAFFFEHEKWEYSDDLIPRYTISSNRLKGHWALTVKHEITDYLKMTVSGIIQTALGKDVTYPRYGASLDLGVKLSKHLNLRTAYRLIYDTKPIVPIRKDYSMLESTLDISF